MDLHFLFTGRYPLALKDEITKNKIETYKKLGPDLSRPYFLTGIAEFRVENRKFTVSFASDTRQNDESADIRPLRVLDIEEHT